MHQRDPGTAPPREAAPQHERFHHLDRLRAFLMLVGIPLHASFGMRMDSIHIDRILLFTSVWRMPTFFLVAGLLSLMVIDRRGAPNWFAGRAVRLGMPLLFLMLFLNPLQNLVTNQLGLLGPPRPLFNNDRLIHGWFLGFLMVICWLLWIALSAAPGHVDRFLSRLGALVLRTSGTLAAASVAVGFLGMWGAKLYTEMEFGRAFSPIGPNVIPYALFFTVGLAIWRTEGGIQRFADLARGPVLVLALVLLPLAVDRDLARMVPAIPGFESRETLLYVTYSIGLLWASILMRLFSRFNRPATPVVKWLVDASLPVYLIHHIFKFLFAPFMPTLTPVVELNWVLASALTVVVSFALYEIVNQFRTSRFALTGTTRRGQGLVEVVRDARAARPAQA